MKKDYNAILNEVREKVQNKLEEMQKESGLKVTGTVFENIVFEALKEAGITAMLTDVVALRVPHATGSLNKAMHQIVDGEVNIEYMYAFANGADAAAVLKSDDPGRVIDILKGSGFDVYSADEAYRANQ